MELLIGLLVLGVGLVLRAVSPSFRRGFRASPPYRRHRWKWRL